MGVKRLGHTISNSKEDLMSMFIMASNEGNYPSRQEGVPKRFGKKVVNLAVELATCD